MLVEPYVKILATHLKEEMEKAAAAKIVSHSHRKQMPQLVNGIVS